MVVLRFCVARVSHSCSLQEFVKDSGSYSKKIVDDLLDQITGGDHSKTIYQLKQVSICNTKIRLIKWVNQCKDVVLIVSALSILSFITKLLICLKHFYVNAKYL